MILRFYLHSVSLRLSIFHPLPLSSFLCYPVIRASLSMSYKSIRESFTHQVAVILSCYRKHCSSQSPPGQLILPESLKLLPMYSNCLLKSDALLSRKVYTVERVGSGVRGWFVGRRDVWVKCLKLTHVQGNPQNRIQAMLLDDTPKPSSRFTLHSFLLIIKKL